MKERGGLAVRLAVRLWLAGVLIFGLVAAFIIMRTDAARESLLLLALTSRADALQTLVKVTGDGGAEMEFDDEITRDYGGRQPTAFFQLLRPDGTVIEQSDYAEAAEIKAVAGATPLAGGSEWRVLVGKRNFQCIARSLAASREGADGQIGRQEGESEQSGRHNDEVGQDGQTDQENGPGGDERWHSAAAAPEIWLVVGVDRTEIDRQFATTVGLTLAGTGAGLLLLCLLAWLLVRHTLQPLTALRRALAGYDERHFAPLAIAAPAEIGEVIKTLNMLMARLAQAFARERAFTADAAHELRTPIAELRTITEVALRRPGLTDGERRDYTVALATALRMQELVEKLLLLARADAGALSLAPAPVVLAPLLAELTAARQPAAQARQLCLRATVAGDVPLVTDAALLRIICDNLLANAIAYADAGTTVDLRAFAGIGGLRFEVCNTAAAISAAECGMMFDRFWRRDAVRRAGSSSGLGLPLSRALAEALGGTLTVDMPVAGTIRLLLCLPQK